MGSAFPDVIEIAVECHQLEGNGRQAFCWVSEIRVKPEMFATLDG